VRVRVRISGPRRKAAFVYPIPPAPRTAVLLRGIRARGHVRVFAKGWCAEVSKFAPQAIAGTLAQLEAIAATDIAVSHAIVVMGRWKDSRVSEADRDWLWARFRVPVFEQIIARDGVLLAAECEAHCGLHIESKSLTLGPTDEIDVSPCLCGRTTPRLILPSGAPVEGSLRRVAAQAR
jgi:hypothetical protein